MNAARGRLHVDCILWDHDGVLVDTEPFFFQATRTTLLDFGVDISREHWLACQARGLGMDHVVATAASVSLELSEVRRARDDLYDRLLSENDVAIDGAWEVVQELGQKFRMALVTTSLRRFVDQLHGDTSRLDHFEHVVTSEDCSRHKPHPEPYLRAMELLGAPPIRSVAVEDSPRGLASAHAAGVRCFVLRNGFMGSSGLEEAHALLDNLRDLPQLVAASPGAAP